MARIVLVGAGSITFAKNLLSDLLTFPELSASTIVLHDIDAERLEHRRGHGAQGSTQSASAPTISPTDRPAALEGADYVINEIQVGGYRGDRADFDDPRPVRRAADHLGHPRHRRHLPRPAHDPGADRHR